MSSELLTRSETYYAGGGMPPEAPPVLDVKRLLWVRGPVMALIAVVLAIPGMLGAWFLVEAKYTATAELRFYALTPRVMEGTAARDQAASYEKFLNTQLSLITGNTILSRVVDSSDVRTLPCIAQAKDPVEFLRDSLGVAVERNSEIVHVTCSLTDAAAAKLILEKVVSAYMEFVFSEEASAGGERLTVLTKERDARQMDLELQLRQISDLKDKLGVPIIGDGTFETREGDQYRENLIKAEEEVSRLEGVRADLDVQMGQVEAILERIKKEPAKAIFEFSVEEQVGKDPRVVALREDLIRAEATMADLSLRMMEKSPQRIEQQRRIDSLRGSLATVEQTVRRETAGLVRSMLDDQRKALQKELDEAQARVGKYGAALKDFEAKIANASVQFAQLAELDRKATETRDLLQQVRRAITDITIESKAPARIQLVSQATVPSGGPVYKQKLLLMLMAIAFSCSVGVGVGFLLEITDQHLRTPQDVLRVTRVPVIACVPHALEDKALPPKVFMPAVTAEFPESIVADEYRRVLVRLLYPEEAYAEAKTIAITSASENDGKTSLACNLAIALGQAHRNVLLVDVSGRKPSLEKCFRLQRAVGLAEVLDQELAPEDAVRVTEHEHVALIGPGLDCEELANRLASRNMVKFLEWAEREFDHVVLDTPPLLLMAEAKLVAPVVDAVLVVCGVGKSTRGMLRRCLRDLNQIGAVVTGLVLNGVRRTRGGYMQANSRKYYGYGRKNAEPPRPRKKPRKPPQYAEEAPVVLIPCETDVVAEVEVEDKEAAN